LTNWDISRGFLYLSLILPFIYIQYLNPVCVRYTSMAAGAAAALAAAAPAPATAGLERDLSGSLLLSIPRESLFFNYFVLFLFVLLCIANTFWISVISLRAAIFIKNVVSSKPMYCKKYCKTIFENRLAPDHW
jgi:hypothetical protein